MRYKNLKVIACSVISALFLQINAAQAQRMEYPNIHLFNTTQPNATQTSVQFFYGRGQPDSTPWQLGATFPTEIFLFSADEGKTLEGHIRNGGEPISLKLEHKEGRRYSVSRKDGEEWVQEGVWSLGAERLVHLIASVEITGSDGNIAALKGAAEFISAESHTATHAEENSEPVSQSASQPTNEPQSMALTERQGPVTIKTANGEWQSIGVWTFGRKPPIELNLSSSDGGKTMAGQVKYEQKEGMLSLKLERKESQTHAVITKRGNEEWVTEEDWILGGSKAEPIIKLKSKSTDGGKTLIGEAVFEGGESVSFKSER